MPTTDELQTQIDALKAFVGLEGYRAGQQRIRESYLVRLQDQIADASLIGADKGLPAEAKTAMLSEKVELMTRLKSRVDTLDKELGPRA